MKTFVRIGLSVLLVIGLFSQNSAHAQGLRHQISYSVDLSGLPVGATVAHASALLLAGSTFPGCSELGEGGWAGKTTSVPLDISAGLIPGSYQVRGSFKPGLCRSKLFAVTVRAEVKINGVMKSINLGAESAGTLAEHVPGVSGTPAQSARAYCFADEDNVLSCLKGVSQVDTLFFPGAPNEMCVGCTGFTFYTSLEDSLKESVSIVLVGSEADAKERITREQPTSP